MEPNQIYGIVNDIGAQAIGSKNLTVFSEQGLISLGRTVLDSQTYVDNFVNILVERIGKTIISHRRYRNKFKGLMKDEIEWGAIVQKVKVSMPEAEEDESYDLTDGQSVDHYKIAKPGVNQKLFITNTPYQFKVTIQYVHLKEAFTSAAAMSSFISAIFGEVQNAIELSLENLGHACLSNMMAEAKSSQVVHLITLYNALVDTTEQVTAANCLINEKFLRFAINQIKNIMDGMTSVNVLYNDGSEKRFTPFENMKVFVLNTFENALETNALYAAFNENYLKLPGHEKVNYWQSAKSPASIDVARASDNSTVNKDGIVACVFDSEALGMHDKDMITSTTPLNSAGLYYNTYYHLKQLWFNDTSEQFVMFSLD